jgi:hypothetical protein
VIDTRKLSVFNAKYLIQQQVTIISTLGHQISGNLESFGRSRIQTTFENNRQINFFMQVALYNN